MGLKILIAPKGRREFIPPAGSLPTDQARGPPQASQGATRCRNRRPACRCRMVGAEAARDLADLVDNLDDFKRPVASIPPQG